MKKYTFDTPQKSVILKDGKTRCFYNETTSERPIIRPTGEAASEQGEAEPETETEYSYEAVDIESRLARTPSPTWKPSCATRWPETPELPPSSRRSTSSPRPARL